MQYSILQLTSSYLPRNIGGREYYVRDLATGLARTNSYNVSILTGDSIGDVDEHPENNLQILRRHYYGIEIGGTFQYRIPHHVIQTLQKIKPDIVHAHDHLHSTSLLSALFKSQKSKLVLTIHSFPNYYTKFPLIRSGIFGYDYTLAPLIFRRADAIIHLSNHSISKLSTLQHFAKGRTYVIPNHFDSQEVDKNMSSSIQEQYGLDKYRVIFACSRIEERKGLQYLVRAFATLSRQIDDVFLVISGNDAGYLNQLRLLVKQQGIENRVLFTGFVSDGTLHSTMTHSAVFVIPSLVENVPIQILKAQYLQVPIIASNVGAISEMVKNQEDGILIEPADCVGLYQKLLYVLHNDTKELVHRAHERVLKYSLQDMLNRTSQVYKDLLE